MFALLLVALELSAIRAYGYFRDELYYIECARHLAWGYVDQPPLSIATLVLTMRVLGDSLVAIRLLPALLGAATVALTGVIARDLGGGRTAQAFAMLAVIVAPITLALDHYYSMNSFEQLLWPLAAWLSLRALERGRSRDWALLGGALGLGLLNKISMLWFGFGLAVGLLSTRERRSLATPGPWLALAIAAAMFAPHVAWQARSGWPMLEFMRNATANKMVAVGVPGFIGNQILLMNPFSAPLWLAGWVWLCRSSRAGSDRVQAILFLTVAALIVVAGRSRASYLAPAYPMLLAAGAVALERATAPGGRRVLRVPYALLLVALGAVLLPLALPVLSEARLIGYMDRIGIHPRGEERHAYGALPQQYADMHGWEAMADSVASVVSRLNPDQRRHALVYAQNYGEASAINFFGRRLGLPRAISGHNNYWLWGPGPADTRVVIIFGGRRADHLASFESVDSVSVFHAPYVMPYEDGQTLFIARRPRLPLAELWPRVRSYN
ncbi:MAG: glycosyltransferase family 39 protein [Candidatus Eisenbacteria bacterium]|nr:glycosyltransferase family 39 protein [Candidatus Eisenbacteria bacterium]